MLTTDKINKEHNGHQTLTGKFKTIQSDNTQHLTPYGGGKRPDKRDKEMNRTPEGDNDIKALGEEHKIPHGHRIIAVDRHIGR